MIMTTITINKKSKAGKILLELAKFLSEKNDKDVVISENGDQSENTPRYNAETEKVIHETRAGKGLNKVKNAEELFKELGI